MSVLIISAFSPMFVLIISALFYITIKREIVKVPIVKYMSRLFLFENKVTVHCILYSL